MNFIFKWLSSFIIEKIVKASFEALSVYFKNQKEIQKEKDRKLELEKIRFDNRNKLNNAIKSGDKDAIQKCAENYINGIDTRSS